MKPLSKFGLSRGAIENPSEPFHKDYLTEKGPLTITKIEGDVVTDSIQGGGTGRFDFVKGESLPETGTITPQSATATPPMN